MTAKFLEDVRAWLGETFPERQVYIRSEGYVQFFSFSSELQAFLATMTLLFLGWVAFASVNVIFKDRIIAAKEKHFMQMQTAYENRVANLQLSYDEANSALVAAQDRFGAKADELEAKQNAILMVLAHRQRADAALSAAGRPVTAGTRDAWDGGATDGATDRKTGSGNVRRASFLDWDGHWAGFLFGGNRRIPSPGQALARHPALGKLAGLTDRLYHFGGNETVLMTRAGGEAADGLHRIETVLRRAGVDPDRVVKRQGQGGPEIPLDPAGEIGVSDPQFVQAYMRAGAALDNLDRLQSGLRRVPLATPVFGDAFDYSSGFGARVDPITGRYAFHPGIDFSGPYGAVVRATAPGVVVGAQFDGAYGNMVEINHGNGIHTRYGHLSAFLVKVGARVDKGTPVGRLGSTGRSTGPHVHYEVWYDGSLRNPRNFIEAGRYVLKQG